MKVYESHFINLDVVNVGHFFLIKGTKPFSFLLQNPGLIEHGFLKKQKHFMDLILQTVFNSLIKITMVQL